MIKKAFNNVAYAFKNYIRKIIIDIIHEERVKPLYESLQLTEYIRVGKFTIYDAMLTTDVKKITLYIEYADPVVKAKKDIRHDFSTISEFKKALENFEPAYKHFAGIHINVYYQHDFGEQYLADVVVNSMNNKIYSSSEFPRIIIPMLSWLNKHPELLI